MPRLEKQIALPPLRKLATAKTKNWWRVLLSAWAPGGTHAEDRDAVVRFALRRNYVSLHHRGQLLGLIGIGHDGLPYASIHAKYAVGAAETDQRYLRFTVKGTASRTKPELHYNLKKWIANSLAVLGPQHAFIDDIAAHNDGVIDFETELPSDEGAPKRAARVDLVALEAAGERVRLAFWESKLIADPRIAQLATPEFGQQFAEHAAWLATRRDEIAEAYASACRHLVAIHDMAVAAGRPIAPLSELVRKVAADATLLDVDTTARVLVRDDGNATPEQQAAVAALKAAGTIPVLVLSGDDCVLRSVA
ncbi:hypothetical protein [Derxia lacustris]|uniref:hypothetical protein n=1 Tax=Derxia lacustris TaxID=764842 RepID=UPI000A1778A2|nr:hypothetical protein [Derxia lacustris]